MKRILTYNSSGTITGRYELVTDSDVEFYPLRLEVGRELTDAEWNASPELGKRVDTAARRLMDKPGVTLSVNSSTILADGVAEAVITVSGLVADARVRLGAVVASVSPTDNTIVFTTDLPGVFVAALVPDGVHVSSSSVVIVAR